MSSSPELADAVEELATIILDFLPGPGPGYAVTPASFQGIARELDLHGYWQGNSKSHAVKALCEGTLKNAPDKFPALLIKIVENSKGLRFGRSSLTVEDLSQIAQCLKRIEIVIPEFESPDFAKDLPLKSRQASPTKAMARPQVDLRSRMRIELVSLTRMPLEEQGYALELFLNKLFANLNLRPISPFRQQEEQIFGTVMIEKQLFSVHASWKMFFTVEKIQEILGSLPLDAKCLIISLPGFLEPVKEFLASGKSPNLIACDLRDLFLVLDGGANLEQMAALKLAAAVKGNSFVLTQDLMPG